MKAEHQQDAPKLKKLFRISHGCRRETLKGLSTFTAVTDKFPLLAKMKFVSCHFPSVHVTKINGGRKELKQCLVTSR